MYMDYITLTKHYEEPPDNYDVISVVAFRLKDNYKSSMIYYYGLSKLIEQLPNKLPNFYLRIYYDDSIITPKHNDDKINGEITKYWIPLFNKLKNYKHVQPVHYNSPSFKIPNSIYHDGLFGTLIRFLPIFDYPENKNLKIVIVSDIDDINPIINNGPAQLKFMKDHDTLIHYKTGSCYTSLSRFNLFSDEYIKQNTYMMIANGMFFKIKIPHEIFDNFLTIMNNLDVKGNDIINEFINNERKSIYKPLDVNMESKFVYGIDEFILAKYIIEYIITNKIPYSYTVNNAIIKALYIWYLKTDKFKDGDKYIDIMKALLGKYYNDKKSVGENYEIMDKMIFFKEDNEDKIYIYDNIFKVFKELETDKTYEKYNLRWRDIHCVNAFPFLKSKMMVGKY
jgi:hypothetical protein